MFKFFRKHQWLLVAALGITCVSFLFWMGNPGGRNGGGGGAINNYGSIDGRKITQEEFWNARNEVEILYWINTGQWPDQNPNFTQRDMQMEIYQRLFLIQQAKKLGIHVGDDAVVARANDFLSSPRLEQAFGLNGESVPLDTFVKSILQPKGLSTGDFENFVRDDLAINQLRQAMGLSGYLVTPQEIAAVYQHEFQERSAQIVFFSASNYLASVPVTPADVDQFYTNYLAEYRLPKRVSVSYVEFSVTNFMATAAHQLTNLNDQVQMVYDRYGTNAFPEAKTPEEAKAKIRDFIVRQQALEDARQKADDFATVVFNMEPVKPENLATVARQKGLAVHVTEPFSEEFGPDEFTAPADFTKAAFGLKPDEPLAGPIIGPDAVYVIALAKQLPSEIPSLSQIRDRVARDYQLHEATSLAQTTGTNFVLKLQIGLATGKSFSAVCAAAGLHAETLPPFSLSTTDLPELGGRVSLNQLKPAVFATEIHHASGFETTDDGGFIVYIKSQLPLDEAAMNANLPQFSAEFRQERETAAYYNWLQHTAGQALLTTPIASGQAAGPSQ